MARGGPASSLPTTPPGVRGGSITPASYGAVDLALGQCADTRGRVDLARRHYEQAIELLDPTGSPHAAVARLHLGMLLGGRDHGAAGQLVADAGRRFDAADLTVVSDRARAALAGVRSRRSVGLVRLDRGWRLDRPGNTSFLRPDLKGFRALAELLSHPGSELHALELAAVIDGRAPVATLGDATTQYLLDDETRRRFRVRLDQIADDLDRADRRGDTTRSAALRAELGDATGFLGRPSRFTTDADRARVNATKHVWRANARIHELDADVGVELRDAVATGMWLRYQPYPGAHRWRVTVG